MVKGNSPKVVIMWMVEGVGNYGGLVYFSPGFLRVCFKPMEQVFGGEIPSLRERPRSSVLSQCEGSHRPQAVELAQFLTEKGFGCPLA